MVITLNNGQTVTIFEHQNIFPQIKEYIDSELYELILKKSTSDFGETIEDLENDITKLENANSSLDEDNDSMEREINDILSQIKSIVDKSRNNKLSITEVENMLEEIWENN